MSKPKIVCKDISMYFYLVMATWILGMLYREKVLFVLNRNMVKNGSSHTGI